MKKVEINLDLGRTEINLKDKKMIITKTLTGYNVLYQSSENCDFKEFEGSYKDYVSKLVKNILEGNERIYYNDNCFICFNNSRFWFNFL